MLAYFLGFLLPSHSRITLARVVGRPRAWWGWLGEAKVLGKLSVLLVWMIVGQGPIALAVGAGGGCLDIFSLICLFSFFLPLFGRRPDID